MFTLDVYKDDRAPAIALLLVTLKKFGTECLDLEPQLLRQEIEKTYNIKLSQINHDKLHAAIIILSTDAFEKDWRVFETCCHILCNKLVEHDELNELETEEIIAASAEASLIKQSVLESEETINYDDEVRAYAGLVFYNHGFHCAPKLFPQAIMPKSNKCDDKEKNEGLQEIFNTRIEIVLDYLEKID